MKKHTSDTPCLSIPTWETLEGWIRDEIEVRIQSIAEEEVTQFLGRGGMSVKELSMRPRVRGLKERFESRILPLFARRTKEVGELLPELYLHGLAHCATSDWRARWRTRFVLVRDFRLRRNELRSFTWMWIKRAAWAQDVTGARAVVRQFRDEQRAAEQAKLDAEERLQRYGGSNKTDTEGRRLDRREFKETTEALRFLATCQMGWYQNRGRALPP